MSQISPKEIMDGFEASRAKTFVYMAQAIIDELGEERGKQVIRDTVWKMSKTSGEAARRSYEKRGEANTWENHRAENGPVNQVAWVGGTVVSEPDLKVVEYSYCPLGMGFAKLGKEAEELGDIYCSVTDDAFWSGFNPEWRVTREKSFSVDGLCRLVWRRKESK